MEDRVGTKWRGGGESASNFDALYTLQLPEIIGMASPSRNHHQENNLELGVNYFGKPASTMQLLIQNSPTGEIKREKFLNEDCLQHVPNSN